MSHGFTKVEVIEGESYWIYGTIDRITSEEQIANIRASHHLVSKVELSGFTFNFKYTIKNSNVTGTYEGANSLIYLSFNSLKDYSIEHYYENIIKYTKALYPRENYYSIRIPFSISDNDEYMYLTIGLVHLESFDSFVTEYTRITELVLDDGYEAISAYSQPEVDAFGIHFSTYPEYVFGKKPNCTLYELEDFAGDKDKCFYNSLKFLGINISLDECNIKELYKYQNYIEYLENNNIDIKIITNDGHFKVDDNLRRKGFFITNDIIDEEVLYGRSDAIITFLYSNNHICLSKGLKKSIMFRNNNIRILKDNKWCNYFTKNTYSKKVCEKDKETKMMFLDFETTYNNYYIAQPYSYSITIVSDAELEELVDMDIELSKNYDVKKAERYNKKFEKLSIFKLGTYDDIKDTLCKLLLNPQYKYNIYTFNGANFDYHILKRILMDKKISHNFFIANSQIITGSIMHKHKLYDVRKFTGASLKAVCDSFKVFRSKISLDVGMGHMDIQSLRAKSTDEIFFETLRMNKNLEEYNKRDTESLAIVWGLFKRMMNKLTEVDWSTKCTLASIGKLILDTTIKEKEIILPIFSDEKYWKYWHDIKKDNPAGRVQVNEISIKEGEYHCPDVCSLYPYVTQIMPVYFPCGELHECTEYMSDKIGFYYCDIYQDNLPLNKKIYPNKTEIENDWRYDGVLYNKFISSIMIDYLLENGCLVNVKSGIYFSDRIKNYELFSSFVEFRKIKDYEDSIKGTPEYNPVRRTIVKDIQNATIGKCYEGLHDKEIKQVSEKDYLKNEKIYDKLYQVTIGSNTWYICNVKKDMNSVMKSSTYIYIGGLIYTYAQIHMHRHILVRTEWDAMDTDSSHMTKDVFDKWNNEYASVTLVPHWTEIEEIDPRYKTHKIYEKDSKVYGSTECELLDNKLNKCTRVIAGKKNYLYIKLDSDDNLIHSSSCKGRCKGSCNKTCFKMSCKGVGLNDKIINDDIKDLESYYNLSTNIIKNNPYRFFERLFNNGNVSISSFSMERHIRTYKTIDASSIKVNYLTKTIKLHVLDCKNKNSDCSCYCDSKIFNQ